jgi:enoyl-CoA hydratase/carnithine racemase
MPEAVIYKKEDHLAVATMNRPEAMNAMNARMRQELGEIYVDFRDDPNAWVLIITGAGDRAFSAGMDLREMAGSLAAGAAPVDASLQPPSIMLGTIDIWKPIIAAINGVAVGAGLELALACDIRISAEHARMGLMEPKRGIIPGGGGLARLPRLLPQAVAMELLLLGDLISSQEAHRIGLVNQVVAGPELMPSAYKMAEKFFECAPLAVQAIKETVYRTSDLPLKEALRTHFGVNVRETEDAKEGTAAFVEKRKPVWKGR